MEWKFILIQSISMYKNIFTLNYTIDHNNDLLRKLHHVKLKLSKKGKSSITPKEPFEALWAIMIKMYYNINSNAKHFYKLPKSAYSILMWFVDRYTLLLKKKNKYVCVPWNILEKRVYPNTFSELNNAHKMPLHVAYLYDANIVSSFVYISLVNFSLRFTILLFNSEFIRDANDNFLTKFNNFDPFSLQRKINVGIK